MPRWPGDRIIIITYSNFRLAQLGISLKPESIPNLINLYLPSPRFLRVLHSPCSTICGHFISSPVSKYYYVFICRLRLLWTSWALPAAQMFAPVNDYWYCYIFQYSLTISGHPLGIYISHRYVYFIPLHRRGGDQCDDHPKVLQLDRRRRPVWVSRRKTRLGCPRAVIISHTDGLWTGLWTEAIQLPAIASRHDNNEETAT